MKPWLWIPASWAHAISPWGVSASAWLANSEENSDLYNWKPFRWSGFHFRNPLGIAGGLDKNAEHIEDWQKLGAGFLEVGTITPQPQESNPGQIINRDIENLALWNRMGFPSRGADYVFDEIRFSNREVPLFINIGKNRSTPADRALEDYLFLAEKFRSMADVLVVNISSPNTQGLRDLAQAHYLEPLLNGVVKVASYTPVLLKISPDMQDEDLKNLVRTAIDCGVLGFIMTNTTLERKVHSPFPAEGGVSGAPLSERSKVALAKVQDFAGADRSSLLLVNCGGVMTSEDVFDRLKRGADLVQVYSALVFQGPRFLKEVALQWKRQKDAQG
ncbi:MAG: quinone-dependent dihydroorotate dehydrogenase [Bdellovibrionales bacterium]